MAKPDNFLWYELMTPDPAAAGAFYSHVVGWKTEPVGTPGNPYTRFLAGDIGVGGMLELPQEVCDRGGRGCWIGYIGVDDVNEYAKRVVDAGGAVCREPADIPGILRFAVVADPYGASFVIFKGEGGPMPEVPRGTPGHVGWRELYGGDVENTFAFYSKLFGWTKGEAMDMGPMGVYQLFAAGGDPVGAIMKQAGPDAGPIWNFYFFVDAIDVAIGRIEEKGGKILMGPHEVPSEEWIVQAIDPQGLSFALVAPRR